jgi:protein-S-isoprenylcysteine O-methyltransferase Ste14
LPPEFADTSRKTALEEAGGVILQIGLAKTEVSATGRCDKGQVRIGINPEACGRHEAMKTLENRIPPPLVMLITAFAMWAAAQSAPALPIGTLPRLAIVLAVAICAGFFAISGFRAFGRAKTTTNPAKIEEASALVTTGIYQYTRNPMYLGLATLLLAWAIYLAVPWAFLGPAAFVLFITRFQIMPEERVLKSKFGSPYAAYQNRVRRWL